MKEHRYEIGVVVAGHTIYIMGGRSTAAATVEVGRARFALCCAACAIESERKLSSSFVLEMLDLLNVEAGWTYGPPLPTVASP
jgi:hypothetical protein